MDNDSWSYFNFYIPPGPSGLPCSSQFFRDSSFVSLLKKTQASTYGSVTGKTTDVYCYHRPYVIKVRWSKK